MSGEWLAQLPEDLRTNEAFTGYATLGDFAKSTLEAQGKLKEFDGKVKTYEGKIGNLEQKLGESIPKLAPDSTPEEKEVYYLSLGRPEKSEDYEFPGEGHSEKMVSWAKQEFYRQGLSKDQGIGMAKAWDALIQGMKKADDEFRLKSQTEAQENLKKEWGEKFNENSEFATRAWKNYTDKDFESWANQEVRCPDCGKIVKCNYHDPSILRHLAKVGKLTGEDTSPKGSPVQGKKLPSGGFIYDKSPPPPKNM